MHLPIAQMPKGRPARSKNKLCDYGVVTVSTVSTERSGERGARSNDPLYLVGELQRSGDGVGTKLTGLRGLHGEPSQTSAHGTPGKNSASQVGPPLHAPHQCHSGPYSVVHAPVQQGVYAS